MEARKTTPTNDGMEGLNHRMLKDLADIAQRLRAAGLNEAGALTQRQGLLDMIPFGKPQQHLPAPPSHSLSHAPEPQGA